MLEEGYHALHTLPINKNKYEIGDIWVLIILKKYRDFYFLFCGKINKIEKFIKWWLLQKLYNIDKFKLHEKTIATILNFGNISIFV